MSTLMTADEAWVITKENKEKFEAVALADVLKSISKSAERGEDNVRYAFGASPKAVIKSTINRLISLGYDITDLTGNAYRIRWGKE